MNKENRSTSSLNLQLGGMEVVASLTEMQLRGDMPVSRFIHAAAEFKGKIFVSGGRDKEGNSLADCFLYDPITSSCDVRESMPQKRSGHTMVAYEGKLYVFGGYDGQLFLDDLICYDPSTGKWKTVTTTGKSPIGRYCHATALCGDRMYVFGGDNHKDVLTDLSYIDLKTLAWTIIVPKGSKLPDARQGHTAAGHGGNFYIFGGFNKSKHIALKDLWKFDTDANQWCQIDSVGTAPIARHGHCGVVFGDSWILHGGRKDHGDKYDIEVYELQFETNEWRRLGVVQHSASPWGCPAVRFGHQAVLEPYTNAVIITGGYTHTDGVTFCPTNSIMRLDLLPTLHSVHSLSSRIMPLEEKLNEIGEAFDELDQRISTFDSKAEELHNTVSSIDERTAQLEERRAEEDEKFAHIEENFSQVEEKVSNLQSKAGEFEDESEALAKRVEALEQSSLDSRTAETEEKFAAAEEKIDELQNKMHEMEEKQTELLETIAELQSDKEALREELNGLTGMLKEKLSDSNLASDVIVLFKRIDNLRSVIGHVSEEAEKLRSSGKQLLDFGIEMPQIDFEPYEAPAEIRQEARRSSTKLNSAVESNVSTRRSSVQKKQDTKNEEPEVGEMDELANTVEQENIPAQTKVATTPLPREPSTSKLGKFATKGGQGGKEKESEKPKAPRFGKKI